jgi:hypothetical protein
MPYYPLSVPGDAMEEAEKEWKRHGAVPQREIERWVMNRAEIHKICSPINAIYDAGTPFFTKAAIRELVQTIDKSGIRPVQTVPLSLHFSIVGIDNKTVNIPIHLGVRDPATARWPPSDDGSVWINTNLDIEFRPADYLTSLSFMHILDFDPDTAFLTMRVHPVASRIIPSTGEVLPFSPDEAVKIRPAPEIRATLQEEMSKWNASAACHALIATFQAEADAGRLPHVDKIVAFACHRLSTPERAERVAAEHAIVLSIRDFFTQRLNAAVTATATAVPCYSQDPVYEDVDREVLAELGVTVLEHPRAFLEVDESSVVFAQAPDIAVRQVVADLARPAVMVWDKVREIPRVGDWVGRVEQ